MTDSADIVIVGAGAAGLMAAIFAARTAREMRRDLRVVALDGAVKIGAKILIAGGGRCNVTHDVVHPEDFNGASRHAIARVLRSFPVAATIDFFEELGVKLKVEEGGKLFPVTDRARTVLEALLRAANDAGAEIVTGEKVRSLSVSGDELEIESTGRLTRCSTVILATGGRSVPKSGSDGGGYALARALGHSLTDTWPALVPLLLPKGHFLTALSGISLDVELLLAEKSGRLVERQRGALLFTHFGLSGPVVLDLSRHWIRNPVELSANLLPGESFDSVDALLRKTATARPRLALASFLSERLPDRVADAVAAQAAEPSTPLSQLKREERRLLARLATALPLPVTGNRGFDYAEVTAGGVPLSEVRTSTMESRIVPRLFLCGEILDVDGRIGGYNFQWAWASGRLAGLSAVSRLARESLFTLP